MTYRLEDLGATEFEHLVQALLLKLYGPTVQVFGPGPDSGRDAVFRGRAKPLDADSQLADPWVGYHVFQVKFHELRRSTEADTTWLLAQIRRELQAWVYPKQGREEKPEYIVFVTNVELGSAVGGGRDKATDEIRAVAKQKGWPLKDCAVWDRAKVERLLDGFADVRQKFNGLISPGDVLAAVSLHKMTDLGKNVEQIRAVLEEDARIELISHGQISLGEGGQVADQRLALAEVAVDLPACYPDYPDPAAKTFQAMARMVEAGDRVLRPSVLGASEPYPHFLVMGGPGQGKTTLGRLLAHLYRASMLDERQDLSDRVKAAAGDTLQRARDIGVSRPRARRWPVRVDLAEYADRAVGGNLSILRYIADRIGASTSRSLLASDLRSWLKEWPWLLVLDGYDEVAAKPAREVVATAVTQLLEQAHIDDADLLVVATTRPHGYSDELPASFRKLELVALSPDEAVRYGTRLTEVRMGDDADKAAVLMRIAEAAANELTGRLMRTPLQVMIMSLLLERRSKPPEDRAALFSSYYDVIYDRESQKKNHLATLLRERRPDVDAIHHATGLRLQIASESDGDAEALLSAADFEGIVRERLTEQGHEGAAQDRLAADLVKAAQDRLVLVTAKGKEQVGFELRSIQEFMAARALVKGGDEEVLHNLSVIAPSAHWRNTWLLAVGTLCRDREVLFERVLSSLRVMDAGDVLSLVVATGPRLAIEILGDGMVAKTPRYVRLLVDHALEILRDAVLAVTSLGYVLAEAGEDELVRKKAVEALDRASQGLPSERAAARLVVRVLSDARRAGVLATRARQMKTSVPEVNLQFATNLSDLLAPAAAEWSRRSVEWRFFEELALTQVTWDPDGRMWMSRASARQGAATAVLGDTNALYRVVQAVADIGSDEWRGRDAIALILQQARSRLPVSAALIGKGASAPLAERATTPPP